MSTLTALSTSFARSLRAEGKAPATIKSYGASLHSLGKHVGHSTDLADINRRVMSDFFLARCESVSHTTVGIEFRSLRVFFKWCVAEEEITDSPMARLKSPRVTIKPVPTFSDAELSKLLASCEGRTARDRRDMAMLRLLLDTGVRRGELAGLTTGDIDVEHQVAIVTGKGKTRLVPFGSRTTVAVDRWLRIRPDMPNLFGLSASGVYQALKDRANLAGVQGWHTHRHRHDVAHRWLVAGGSEGDLMALAGWSSRSLLDRYGASRASERAIAAHRRMSLGDAI